MNHSVKRLLKWEIQKHPDTSYKIRKLLGIGHVAFSKSETLQLKNFLKVL